MPLHRLPADPRRRRTRSATRRRTTRWPPGATRRRRLPAHPVVGTRVAEFVRPADLAEALALLAERPGRHSSWPARTDWGVEVNLRGARAALVVGDRPARPSCGRSSVSDDVIEIGAALTLSEIERGLAGRVPLLAELFPQFASRLIRNGATLGGNLGTGSPIGDAPPALLALDASVVLASRDGEREVAAGRLLHRLPADACASRTS